MSWTCPHCQEIVEEPATGSIQFCLHCGMPATPEEKTVVAARDQLDGVLRALLLVFGLLWLVFFFIPFGEADWGTVMSWDLLANREGMSYLVSWPLLLAIMFLVLGAVGPFPGWLRSGTALLLGGAFLILLGTEEPGGPLGEDVRFVFGGGFGWILLFPVVGAGLMLRARSPRSITARVLIGVGLLLGLVAYLSSSEGESTLVGALLRFMARDEATQAIARVIILLPLFLLLASTIGFRMPAGSADPALRWTKIVGWVWLIYLPAFLLLYGFMMAGESGYYFLMFLRLSIYVAGLVAMLVVSITWLSDFVPRQILPLLRGKSDQA